MLPLGSSTIDRNGVTGSVNNNIHHLRLAAIADTEDFEKCLCSTHQKLHRVSRVPQGEFVNLSTQ